MFALINRNYLWIILGTMPVFVSAQTPTDIALTDIELEDPTKLPNLVWKIGLICFLILSAIWLVLNRKRFRRNRSAEEEPLQESFIPEEAEANVETRTNPD